MVRLWTIDESGEPGERLRGVARIATIDLLPGHPVGAQRHNGFMSGFGLKANDAKSNELSKTAEIVCMADSFGDRAKGQTGMENCLQKNPDINIVYTINEPAAQGANGVLKTENKSGVIIVSVDGGCKPGLELVSSGVIGATAQQYPGKMATLGMQAIKDLADGKPKPAVSSGLDFFNTGVALVTDKAVPGVTSISVADGQKVCWGA